MRKGTLHVAMATAALLAVGAAGLKAETPVVGPSNNTVELRVVNHHAAVVQVYVQDARGRIHALGRVASADFGILQIPGTLTAMGEVEIKIYPSEPVGSLMGGPDGIRTQKMNLKLGDAVNLFVETSLTASQVEVERG